MARSIAGLLRHVMVRATNRLTPLRQFPSPSCLDSAVSLPIRMFKTNATLCDQATVDVYDRWSSLTVLGPILVEQVLVRSKALWGTSLRNVHEQPQSGQTAWCEGCTFQNLPQTTTLPLAPVFQLSTRRHQFFSWHCLLLDCAAFTSQTRLESINVHATQVKTSN